MFSGQNARCYSKLTVATPLPPTGSASLFITGYILVYRKNPCSEFCTSFNRCSFNLSARTTHFRESPRTSHTISRCLSY